MTNVSPKRSSLPPVDAGVAGNSAVAVVEPVRRVGRPRTVAKVRGSDGVAFPASKPYKQWVFTAFSEDVVDRIQGAFVPELYVVGRELAPTTKRVHYQAVMRVPRGVSFQELHDQFPDVHFERCKSINKSVKYCRKDGDMVYDQGFGNVQASRTKAKEDTTLVILDIIENATSYREGYEQIKREHPLFLFWHRRKVQEALMDKFPPPGGLALDAWAPYGGYGAQ